MKMRDVLFEAGVLTTKKGTPRRSRRRCQARIKRGGKFVQCHHHVEFLNIDPLHKYCNTCYSECKAYAALYRDKAKAAKFAAIDRTA